MSNTLTQKTAALFERFCEKFSKINPVDALAVTATLGAMTWLYGVGMEVQGQADLIQAGGQAALDAYNNTISMLVDIQRDKHPDGGAIKELTNYINTALAGGHESFGGNAQGTGLAIIGASPVIALATFTLSNGFKTIKEFLSQKSAQNQEENETQNEIESQPMAG